MRDNEAEIAAELVRQSAACDIVLSSGCWPPSLPSSSRLRALLCASLFLCLSRSCLCCGGYGRIGLGGTRPTLLCRGPFHCALHMSLVFAARLL